MSWGQIFKQTAKSILGVVAIVVIVISFAIIMGGCSTAEKVVQHSETAEDAFEQADDLMRAGERAAQQARETGQAASRLTPERSCVEAKNTEERYMVDARLIGTDQRHTLDLNEYKRFEPSGGWLTDKHQFTVEMEIFDKQTGEFSTRAQTIENNFDRYELTKQGCGILYFVADGDRIEGLAKPGKTNLH